MRSPRVRSRTQWVEQIGRHAGVADEAAVRAAVGEAEHRARVQHHLAQRVEVAVDVVGQRREEQLPPVALEQPVVDDLLGPAPVARRDGSDAASPAPARSRADRRAGRCSVQLLIRTRAIGVVGRRLLGEQARAHCGIAQARDALGERQMRPARGDRSDG